MKHPKLLTVDARKRITLGALARHDHYTVALLGNGALLLTPVELRPTTEFSDWVGSPAGMPQSGATDAAGGCGPATASPTFESGQT